MEAIILSEQQRKQLSPKIIALIEAGKLPPPRFTGVLPPMPPRGAGI